MSKWDELTMAEKAEMMKVAVRNGIYNLNDIRQKYNEFAEGGELEANTFKGGGYKPSDSVKKRISTWEGTAMTGAIDPLSGKWGKNRSFEAEATSFYDALPSNIREHVLSNPELADHLFSYSYNVGAGNFKKRVVPALKKYYTGNGSPEEIANSMWATGDKKLRGLRNRRAAERKGVVDALTPSFISEPADNTFMLNPFAVQAENTYTRPVVIPDEDSYVTAHEVSPSEQKAQEIKERFDAINRFNTILNMLNMNASAPAYTPDTGNSFIDAIGVLTNSNAHGGKIHIAPSKRGTFTAAAKKHGKSVQAFASQVLAHPENYSPAMRKKANFARNAAKWHGHGGNLFDGTTEDSQQMKIGKPYYSYDENGRKIDDTLNYNISFPEIVITPDSRKSPAKRNENERYRQRTQRDYAEQKSRDYTERQVAKSQREWDNSLEKAVLDYGQAAATGIGIGTDIVSGLPIYSSLKGARILNEAETPMDYVEGGLWLTPFFGGAYQTAKPALTSAVGDILTSHPALYQYPRYAVGKFKYGMDAELPTVFRKVNALPKVENGKIVISNPNNRFAYDNGFGEQSPIITNFTTDAPVRSHSAGNWDRGLTLAFPGKRLLGKNVISTQPSDTFIFGDNITIPVKDITGFSGRQKELDYLGINGIKSITSPEAKVFWESGASDLANKIAQARATNTKIFQNRGKGIVLLKPKTPYGDFSNYANTIENLTRETFKSPTLKDYQFMDYVFKPKFTSEVTPKVENFTFGFINKNPIFGEWLGNSERRTYLDQSWRWGNLMYDPLTPVESEFRSELNIGLKPGFKR